MKRHGALSGVSQAVALFFSKVCFARASLGEVTVHTTQTGGERRRDVEVAARLHNDTDHRL